MRHEERLDARGAAGSAAVAGRALLRRQIARVALDLVVQVAIPPSLVAKPFVSVRQHAADFDDVLPDLRSYQLAALERVELQE